MGLGFCVGPQVGIESISDRDRCPVCLEDKSLSTKTTQAQDFLTDRKYGHALLVMWVLLLRRTLTVLTFRESVLQGT